MVLIVEILKCLNYLRDREKLLLNVRSEVKGIVECVSRLAFMFIVIHSCFLINSNQFAFCCAHHFHGVI